ncbi:MAG: endonuclease/exonuclease/phosphatase family protein [Chitinophagaceae bacterium]
MVNFTTKSFKPVLLCCCMVLGMACAKKTNQGIAGAGTASTDTSSALKVLTYNIHHANPPSRPDSIDLKAIARVITQEQPDLVALQEVDVYTVRSGKGIHQADELARLTGMKAYFAKAIDYGGGEYGVAVLSKLPMEAMKNNPLPTAAGTNGERRTLGSVIITLPNGNKIRFAFTHLDAQSSSVNRLLQIREIASILQTEKLPVIIAGDFNAVPGTEVINILDSSFTRTCVTGCGFTIPVVNPNKTIDFIAFKPRNLFTVVDHQVIDEKYASDHLPVKAVLKLQ